MCSSTTIPTLLPHVTDLVKVKIEEKSSSEEDQYKNELEVTLVTDEVTSFVNL